MFCGNPAVSLPPSRWRAVIIGCGFPTSERNARAHGTYPLYSIRIRVRENPGECRGAWHAPVREDSNDEQTQHCQREENNPTGDGTTNQLEKSKQ
jgi:hypothetical protein